MRIMSIDDELVLVSQVVLLIRFFRSKTSGRSCTLFKPGLLLFCVSIFMSPMMATLSYLVIARSMMTRLSFSKNSERFPYFFGGGRGEGEGKGEGGGNDIPQK